MFIMQNCGELAQNWDRKLHASNLTVLIFHAVHFMRARSRKQTNFNKMIFLHVECVN
jgi:hypothetical protein